MPCYHPLTAYRSKVVGDTGKRGITFDRNASLSGIGFDLPCGQCIGCRLERSRQWAVRCMHEKSMHTDSVFMTLTYDNAHLPENNSLVKRDLQLFMKRLRDKIGAGLRFYACGEYGETSARPHYHVLLFNYNFIDKRFYKLARAGQRLYTSEFVDSLWKRGYNVLGDVDFDSCAYVARYIMKKITGKNAEAHYGDREPEFTCMSRRPGVGDSWFKKYGEHAYSLDSVIINGREVRPPRFYDTRFEVLDSEALEVLKEKRRRAALKHRADLTPDRRKVRERHAHLILSQKKEQL